MDTTTTAHKDIEHTDETLDDFSTHYDTVVESNNDGEIRKSQVVEITVAIIVTIIVGLIAIYAVGQNNDYRARVSGADKCVSMFPDYLNQETEDLYSIQFDADDAQAQPALDCMMEALDFTMSSQQEVHAGLGSHVSQSVDARSGSKDTMLSWSMVNMDGRRVVQGLFVDGK